MRGVILNDTRRGKEPGDVRLEVDDLLRVFTLVPDPANLLSEWLEVCTAHQVRGRQAFDARLVALMVASGITRFVTLNAVDFGRYPMIELIVP
jgi:predicted nucleic acid-binding protein